MSNLIPNHQYAPELGDGNAYKYVQTWLAMHQKTWDRLGENRQERLIQKVWAYAASSLAALHIRQLQPIADREISPDIRAVIKWIVIVTGGFTFGIGMRVITSGWGIFAVPAGFLGGAIASFVVDWLATDAFTNLLKRLGAQRRLQAVDQRCREDLAQRQERLPLLLVFYQAQRDLVFKMEGEVLQKSVPVRAILALMMSGIELSIALFIVQNMPVLAVLPVVLRVVLAALPVVLTYAAALGQAIAFNLPTWARVLVTLYRDGLETDPAWSDADMQHWYLSHWFEDGGLMAWIEGLFDRYAVEPSPALAQFAYQRQFLGQGMEQLQVQMQGAVRDRWAVFSQMVEGLPDRFEAPPIDETQLTDREIEQKQREIEQLREHWVERETQRLREETMRDVTRLQEEYSGAIGLWQGALAQVTERYDVARRRWEHGQEEGNDFDNVA